ncbi:ScyD/ScyE family protein [Ilyomonas limi]|uniref:ScyD/ScyE family protein n=1 Tax=Ilyomonas limi TaxID=2575867 RepID=A0A4V5UUP7_9BACT|nr:ScyD/ScyE family protein [Ilyomonas limi]TKK68483.1 ScyD/ScyE family protein [Ilyomonas limi]
MKTFLQSASRLQLPWLYVTCIALLSFSLGCNKVPDNLPTLHITTVASGLVSPMGLETDAGGNIWICETGTAAHDGKVVVVTPSGEVYDAIVNLASINNAVSGEVEGPAHLLLDKGVLHVLAGNYLYNINVSNFKPGDTPIDASTLPYEDIGSFVLSYPFVNNAHDTHPYNLTKGPEGDLYIADAGANAVLHRKGANQYTVLAELPNVANPTPIGSPEIQCVPTGIMYDGRDFLVTTLTGFPFPTGSALIYKISMSGSVSVYQDGLTTLVDIAEGHSLGHLVLQHATFGLKGFEPNSGALVWANGKTIRQLAGGLNIPVGLKQVNIRTWYITSLGDGTLLKAAYY